MNHCKTCEYFHREWLMCFRQGCHVYDNDTCDKWEIRKQMECADTESNDEES